MSLLVFYHFPILGDLDNSIYYNIHAEISALLSCIASTEALFFFDLFPGFASFIADWRHSLIESLARCQCCGPLFPCSVWGGLVLWVYMLSLPSACCITCELDRINYDDVWRNSLQLVMFFSWNWNLALIKYSLETPLFQSVISLQCSLGWIQTLLPHNRSMKMHLLCMKFEWMSIHLPLHAMNHAWISPVNLMTHLSSFPSLSQSSISLFSIVNYLFIASTLFPSVSIIADFSRLSCSIQSSFSFNDATIQAIAWIVSEEFASDNQILSWFSS